MSQTKYVLSPLSTRCWFWYGCCFVQTGLVCLMPRQSPLYLRVAFHVNNFVVVVVLISTFNFGSGVKNKEVKKHKKKIL